MILEQRQLFDAQAISQRWGVSKYTVIRRMNAGELKSVNIGSRRLVPLSEIERVEQFGIGTPRKRRGR